MGTTTVGLCKNTDCSLVIDKDTHIDFQKTTLLHEIIEALSYRLELNLKHSQITALEGGLFQVIKDNPKLLEYFKNGTN